LVSLLALVPLCALLLWWCSLWLLRIPVEDRTWLDTPPLLFRPVWPLIRILAVALQPLLRKWPQPGLQLKLSQAGVEYRLTPDQFRTSQWLCAMFCVALTAALPGSLISSPTSLGLSLCFAVGGWAYPLLWLRETRVRRGQKLLRALPFFLDVVTLSIEAGSNLTSGLGQVSQKMKAGPLHDECNRVLREIRSGRSRAEALRAMADRAATPLLRQVVSSMNQAEQTGSNLGPVLRAQAEQARKQRFMQAEKRAMEAPVRLLLPLVLFIFPTTFLVIGFVLLGKAIQSGMVENALLVWAYYWPAGGP